MDFTYAITPFVAWVVAGSLKFAINSIRAGKPAFGLIGYGGFPSNHSSVVSSAAALVALKEGIDHPAFGIAVALIFIVMLDASSLRRQVGKQAQAINALNPELENPLRERIGHSKLEIAGGIATGTITAWAIESYCTSIFIY